VLNLCFKGGFVPTPSDESINRGPVCEHMHALKRSWNPCRSAVGDRCIRIPSMHSQKEAG